MPKIFFKEIKIYIIGHFRSKIPDFSIFFFKNQTFSKFESSDRSDTAYYASIKWVEAFAKDRMSKFFLKEVKKYIIDNFLWPSTKELSLLG